MSLALAISLGITGAHVEASGKTGSVATDVAVSSYNGMYKLQVPVPRLEKGSLIDGTLTLRGEANDYKPYPSRIRPSIPVDNTQAVQQEDGTYVLKNAATNIGLIKQIYNNYVETRLTISCYFPPPRPFLVDESSIPNTAKVTEQFQLMKDAGINCPMLIPEHLVQVGGWEIADGQGQSGWEYWYPPIL